MFSNGFAPVQDDNDKWGFIDKTGRVVIPCQWKAVYSFQEGLAPVQDDNNKWGVIDMTGKIVIPCQWSYADFYQQGELFLEDGDDLYFVEKTENGYEVTK
jgi:hypothetical protein